MPDRVYVFLDANVIFSASYKPNSRFLGIWRNPAILTMTSLYAAEEARRNCDSQQHMKRLEALLDQTAIVSDPLHDNLPAGTTLQAKDRPILASAIDAGAQFLVTGDRRHFGPWMNRPIKTRYGNLIILEPAPFLAILKTV